MAFSSFRSLWVGRLAGVLVAAVSLASCFKEEPSVDYAQVDEATIQKYIADNQLTGAQRQASGLYLVPVRPGTGDRPQPGDSVSVLYTDLLLDGRVFDASSLHGNKPIKLPLGRGQVIAGWDEGIGLLNKGAKATLLIPSNLAYGSQSIGGIPSRAVLRFDVELVDIKK